MIYWHLPEGHFFQDVPLQQVCNHFQIEKVFSLNFLSNIKNNLN